MTQKQALSKARSLWGKNARVDHRTPHVINGVEMTGPYVVGRIIGRITMVLFFAIESDGSSWEDCFRKWEAKQQQERDRIAEIRKKKGLR